MALHIKSNNEVNEVAPAKGKKFKLDELQALVGGYIELVPIPGDRKRYMVANEEGQIHGLPLNQIASHTAARVIVGDVVVCKKGEV